MPLAAHSPALSVKVTGGDIAPSVLQLRVQQRLNHPALCELTLFEIADPPPLGSEFVVVIGAPGHLLFEGRFTAISRERGADGLPSVRLRGYDALHRLRRSQTVRGFDDMTTAEIATRVAAAHGLSVHGATGPRWARVLQTRQTDLALLQELAETSGLFLRLQGTQLELVPSFATGAAVELDALGGFLEISIEENLDRAVRSVAVRGWNAGSAAAVAADASGQPGASLALSRLGIVCDDAMQARALAETEVSRRAQAGLTLEGLAYGNATLKPGSAITVTWPGAVPKASVVLHSVIHTIDAERGFLTEVSSKPPPGESRAGDRSGGEATLAEVTSVADPSHQARVKVRLIAMDGVETGWLPVLLAGAGRAKGLMALPAPGDRVLVMLLGGHPLQAVVIGSLIGPDDVVADGVEGNAVKRFILQTPGGQRVTLDDAARSLLLEQSGGANVLLGPDEARVTSVDGSFLAMTSGATVLHATGDLTLRAPGRKLTIAASAIDFEQM